MLLHFYLIPTSTTKKTYVYRYLLLVETVYMWIKSLLSPCHFVIHPQRLLVKGRHKLEAYIIRNVNQSNRSSRCNLKTKLEAYIVRFVNQSIRSLRMYV